jgi:anti-sigma factor RsiW
MSMSIPRMIECRRTRRRLQRFLDRDPAALLSPAEVAEVEQHLQGCERCTGLVEEYRALHKSLDHLGSALEPDDETVLRVRRALDRALENEDRG